MRETRSLSAARQGIIPLCFITCVACSPGILSGADEHGAGPRLQLAGEDAGEAEGGTEGSQMGLEGGAPAVDGGLAQADTLQPDTRPEPDLLPATPQPPFGDSVGETLANVTNLPDCSGTVHSLHEYYNKHRGLLLVAMHPS